MLSPVVGELGEMVLQGSGIYLKKVLENKIQKLLSSLTYGITEIKNREWFYVQIQTIWNV